MKTKITILSCLMAVAVLFVSYEKINAAAVVAPSSGIGVVSIQKVFEKCERNEKYRKEAKAEQDRIIAELEMIRMEIEAEEAGLKTLRPDSEEYLKKVKEVVTKRASFQPQQDFYKQYLESKDKKWTEALYSDILEIVKDVAGQKGLNVVFSKSEIEFPAATPNDLMLTIRTHKVLYCGGCDDITDEVIKKLDEKDR